MTLLWVFIGLLVAGLYLRFRPRGSGGKVERAFAVEPPAGRIGRRKGERL